MASNRFGTLFCVTTWGESHGKAIGAVLDGCPAGLPVCLEEIQQELNKRVPGKSAYTSPRKEPDSVEILSGVFEGITTGAPICLIIWNKDIDSSSYKPIKDLLRPGHANFTYLEKYKIFDYNGGGRSSARETACRVAAGYFAKKILLQEGIQILAYIKQIGDIAIPSLDTDFSSLQSLVEKSSLFCPCSQTELVMKQHLLEQKKQGDSLGGVVECIAKNLKAGLGDPVYEKLEANLAKAMLSIPASKGVEFGEGFACARMQGSDHNDLFTLSPQGKICFKTNHAGGTLGGISTGMPLVLRVAFKPTSSIQKPQNTLSCTGETATLQLEQNARHDPCIAIRAVPVVEAMMALTLVDALLYNKSVCLSTV